MYIGRRRSGGIIAGVFLLLFGLVFGGVAAWTGWDSVRLLGSGVTTQGEVLRVTQRTSTGRNRGPTFCPEVVYNVGATRHTFQGVCSNPAAYRVGDKVEVRYDRAAPATGRINSFTDMWLFPLLFGFFGLVAFLLGLFISIKTLLRTAVLGGMLFASLRNRGPN